MILFSAFLSKNMTLKANEIFKRWKKMSIIKI